MRDVFANFVALLTRNAVAKRCVFADLYTWFIYNTLYNRRHVWLRALRKRGPGVQGHHVTNYANLAPHRNVHYGFRYL